MPATEAFKSQFVAARVARGIAHLQPNRRFLPKWLGLRQRQNLMLHCKLSQPLAQDWFLRLPRHLGVVIPVFQVFPPLTSMVLTQALAIVAKKFNKWVDVVHICKICHSLAVDKKTAHFWRFSSVRGKNHPQRSQMVGGLR